jgi:hypothetical protein
MSEVPATMSPNLPPIEKALVQQFPIDATLVGNTLGQGMGHTVYAYGQEEVLKVPRLGHIKTERTPSLSAERRQETVAIIKAYFPDNALETKVITSPTTPTYLMRQRRLGSFANITPGNAPTVQAQLDELLATNHRLLRERGMSLDFLGKEGMTQCVRSHTSPSVEPAMSNLVIEATENGPKIVIADMSLLRLSKLNGQKTPNQGSWVVNGVTGVTFGINRRLIRRAFGIDIAPVS